jgi:general secretion pathway protein K
MWRDRWDPEVISELPKALEMVVDLQAGGSLRQLFSSGCKRLKRPVPPGERGAALLAVLLLVAVTGAIAATALERIRISTSVAINSAALDQARSFAMGIESLLALRVDDLVRISPENDHVAGGWNGETRRLPMPGGALAHATLRDGGNCFNINSLRRWRRGSGAGTDASSSGRRAIHRD